MLMIFKERQEIRKLLEGTLDFLMEIPGNLW